MNEKMDLKDAMLTRADLEENIVIIKINKLYRPDMSAEELYEATRCCWKRKIDSVSHTEYCLSVFNGIVVEVYKITGWYKAGTIPTKTRVIETERLNGRIEFSGFVAEDKIRNKYIGKSVENLFKRGEASPIKVFLKNAQNIDDTEVDDTYMNKNIKFSHNTILYGPPGTGKTYNTVIYAVSICDGKSVDELTDYKTVMDRYKQLLEEHRIAFTTFHQSYGYEEFIEGIKPNIDYDNEKSDIEYKVTSGVFKAFCEEARNVQLSDIDNKDSKVWVIRNRAGDKDVSVDFEERLYKESVIKIEDIINYNRQCRLFPDMNMGDWVVLGKGYTINAIGIIADEAPEEINDGVFHWQRKVKWLGTNLEYNCKEINGGKYISNFAVAKSRMTVINLQKLVTDKKNEKPYVFIIDEINRGNISKIFGELITLIEDSKREGTAEEACVILPYSGEKFSVPSNVYILGTMNTADRSIALMDTALRRRFDFIEMMPKSEILREKGADKVVVDGHELDVAAMLDTINERITFLYDREHTIGHAFFMGLVNEPSIEKLATIFRKSVVPLLQEYFYDDYQKIQLVLGDNGKTDETHKFIKDSKVVARTMFKGNVDDIIDLPEKKFEINDEAFDNILSYIEIM
jgi:5-methylcytosine-specific restriction protein B